MDSKEESLGDYIINGFRAIPPEKICQVNVVDGKTCTFGELLKKNIQVASGLAKAGVQVEDVIAIVSSYNENSIPLVFGTIFSGAVPFAMDPSMKHVELCHMFKLAKPKLVFVVPEKAEAAVKALEAIGRNAIVFSLDDGDFENEQIRKFSSIVDPTVDVAKYSPRKIMHPNKQIGAIVPSSGTTGLPKGVASSHAAYLIQLRIYEQAVYSVPFLQMTPLFWMTGLLFLMLSARVGYLRVYTKNNDPENILPAIQNYKIGWFMIAPINMARILNHPTFESFDLSSLKWIYIGGSSVPTKTINQVAEKLPHTILQQGYGASEISGAITSPFHREEKYSAGKLLDLHDVKIVDIHTRIPVGANQEGEIIIKSPTLMSHYLSYENDNHSGLDENGYYLTGDVGYISEGGYVYITSRIKELIKVKNHQVSPVELEEVIRTIPGVADAAVVGIPHEIEQNHPRALVVKQDDAEGSALTEEMIINEVADKLSDSKHLFAGAQFVDSIPRNASGKIIRNRLLQLVKM